MDAVDILIVVLAAAWIGFGIWVWLYPSPEERIRRTVMQPAAPARFALFWLLAGVQTVFIVLLLLAFAISRLL